MRSPKPPLQWTPPQKTTVEIIHVDEREATDFPSEPAGLGALPRLLHVEPIDELAAAPIAGGVPHSSGGNWLREWSADARYVSALTRRWRISEASRPVPFGLAAAALAGVLVIQTVQLSNALLSSDTRANAQPTDQSAPLGVPVADVAIASERATVPFSGVSGGSTDRQQEATRTSGRSVASEFLAAERSVRAPAGPSADSVSRSTSIEESLESLSNPSWLLALQTAWQPPGIESGGATPTSPSASGSVAGDPRLIAPRTENGDAGSPGTPPGTPERVQPALESADSSAVQALLVGYQAAYEQLDAQLAKALWPGVNERALERAFKGLESQTVTFDRCDVRVGDTQAVASCSGTAMYVTRIGRRSSHTENRLWTFRLEKSAERWVIDAVEIQ